MNPEEASEVAAELAKAFDAFIALPNGERRECQREKLQQLLWDNKIGIVHALKAYARSPVEYRVEWGDGDSFLISATRVTPVFRGDGHR